jgi:ATP-binding cassette, subfamily C (CFTR/MRP), member 1
MCSPKSLWLALARAYGSPYALAASLKFLQDALAFLQPQLLRWLLSFIAAYQSARQAGTPTPNPLEGIVAALLMAATSVIQSITLHQVGIYRLGDIFY